MSNSNKYELENLVWQQFELLCYQCMLIDCSKRLKFIDGGNDKGRDFILSGTSKYFDNDDNDSECIFQVKHKSTLDFNSLKNDLKSEIKKVFVTNQFDYDNYCLVTNLKLTGDQFDSLTSIFSTTLAKNSISKNIKFHIYSYRNIEACLDKNDYLKWQFPSIIKNVDFRFLMEDLFQKRKKNNSKVWCSIFEKNKQDFVNTNIFQEAISKLETNNIILFSGPSKSGKSFNAEMILLYKFSVEGFTPHKIDKIEDFDEFYHEKEKQIFLFDDAFGKYNTDFSLADAFNRKLDAIYSQSDDHHKCVFTSREYIFKSFENYSDHHRSKFFKKITVEVDKLDSIERKSIFLNYYKNYISNKVSANTEMFLESIIKHKNFSPETIRAYFTNNKEFDLSSFFNHLNSPDEYLEKDFINLSEEKKIVLLSTLLSLNGNITSISYSYRQICDDFKINKLLSINNILHELDGSILKFQNNEISFYHPSMFEFFVRYISKEPSTYRSIILTNFNIKFLNVLSFNPKPTHDIVNIETKDIDQLLKGFERLLNHPMLTLAELNSLLCWINNPDIQLNLKIRLNSDYKMLKSGIVSSLVNIDLSKFLDEDIYYISDFLKNISLYYEEFQIQNTYFEKLIQNKKSDPNYWLLVFRMMPLLEKKHIFQNITKEWLNSFYKSTKTEILNLGNELFGNVFPNFNEIHEQEEQLNKSPSDIKFYTKRLVRSDYIQETNENWYPRFLKLKEKISVLKSSQPYGYRIHEKLIENFSHLQAMEEIQMKRNYKNFDDEEYFSF